MPAPGDGSTLSPREREALRASARRAAAKAPPMSLRLRREIAAHFGFVLDEDLEAVGAGTGPTASR